MNILRKHPGFTPLAILVLVSLSGAMVVALANFLYHSPGGPWPQILSNQHKITRTPAAPDLTKQTLNAKLDSPVLATVAIPNNNYSFFFVKQGQIASRQDNSTIYATDTQILMSSKDISLIPRGSEYISNFTLKNGKQTEATIMDKGLSIMTLTTGQQIPVKILDGQISDGHLIGFFKLQTFFDNRFIAGQVNQLGQITSFQLIPGATALTEIQTAIARQVLKSKRLLTSVSPTLKVLGTQTNLQSSALISESGDFNGISTHYDPELDTWSFSSPTITTQNLTTLVNQNTTSPKLNIISKVNFLSAVTENDITTLSLNLVDTINSDSIIDGSITGSDLENGSVNSDKISDGAITNDDISDQAQISDSKLGQITIADKVAGSALALASHGGLVDASGLSLLTTCAPNQVLRWDGTQWACATISAGSPALDVQENGSTITAGAGFLNFSGPDFIVTNSPVGTANVSLEHSSGNWTFTNTSNQLVLGTTNTTTINSTAPSAIRTYTIPDFGSNDTFVGLAANQALSNKTISGLSNTLSNIANSSLTNSSVSLAGGSGSGSVALGATLTVSGSGIISTSVSGSTITLAASAITGSDLAANISVSTTGNLTTTGSGVVTSAGAFVGPTATNTINGLIINSGALSGISGYTQTSGNFALSGTGTFTTNTGTVSLNGDTTVASGKLFTITGGAGNPTATNGTVWYDTTANKYKIVESGQVKTLCNTTDLGCGSAGAGIATVKEAGSNVVTSALSANFAGNDFLITDETGGQAGVAIDYPNSGITRKAQAETITGGWTFNTLGTTFTTGITANGGLTTAAGTGLSLGSGNNGAGTAGNLSLDVGTSTAGNGSILIGTAARNQTITIGNSTGGTITIGQTSGSDLVLNDAQWSVTGPGAASFSSLTNTGFSAAGVVTNAAGGALSTLPGTTTTVLHGNAGGAPSFSSISGSDLAANIAISTTGNITTTGSGVVTSAGAFVGPTATNTINGLIINSAALSGITGYTQTSGNFALSGTGTFTTNTGTVSLNGDTTVASGKLFTITGGAGNPTATNGTVWYDTTANKYKIVESGQVKTLCNTTDLGCGSAGAGIATVKEAGSNVVTSALSANFAGNDFLITDETGGQAGVAIDYPNSGITRKAQAETITGGWTFNTLGTTFTTGITANGGLTTAAGTSLSLGSGNNGAGTAGNLSLDVGTSTAGNGSILIGTAARNQTITIGNSTGGTITIGQTSGSDLVLNDAQWSVTGPGAASFSSLTNTGFSAAGVVTNAAGGALSTLPGTTTTVLHGNAGGAPSFSSISGSDLAANIAISTTGNITTTGSGVVTSAGAFVGPTATNTINGLIINSGALSGISTLNASGQITSTLATGTAPFVVASTTNVANLNASSLNGATFASPGNIGTGTAGSGTFTSLTATGLAAAGVVTNAAGGALSTLPGTTTTVLHGNAGGAPSFSSISGSDLASNIAISSTGTLGVAATTITAQSANALAVGRQGTTSPAFQVDSNTASSVTGLKLTAGAAGGGFAAALVGGNTDEALTLSAKGAGTLTLASGSTGDIQFFSASNKLTSAGALTVAGAVSATGATLTGMAAAGVVTNAAGGALSTLPGTTTTVLHGNAGGAPSFSSISGSDLASNIAISSTGTLGVAATTITAQSANALAVGRQGTTSPAFQVDSNTASSVTGLKLTAGAAGGGFAAALVGGNTDEALTLSAKGAGTLTLASGSTGDIQFFSASNKLTSAGALTVAGAVSATGATLTGMAAAGVVTNAAGGALSTLPGTTTTVLHGNAGGAPSFSSISGSDLASNIAISSTGTLGVAATTITAQSANALAVGRQGTTSPAFQVDSNTASSVTGLKLTAGAAGGGFAAALVGGNTDEALTLSAKGAGTLTLASGSTGDIQFFSASNKLTSAGALTVAGAVSATGATLTGMAAAGVVTNAAGGALSTLPGTTTTVLHGNAGGAPSFSSISGSDLAANIAISTTGNITTTGSGVVTSAGAFVGPTATNTINGLIINSGALSGISTLNASGQITSTLATGTAPFMVASTTNVANLNASSLNGATFASPGNIGTGTAGSGTFTSLTATGLAAAGVVTNAAGGALSTLPGTTTTVLHGNAGGAPSFSSISGSDLASNIAISSTGTLGVAATTITAQSANALAVGRQGTTSPAFQVDSNTASSVTGLKLTAGAAGGGFAAALVGGNTDEALTLSAKGAGTLTLASGSTGDIQFFSASNKLTSAGALTVAGSISSAAHTITSVSANSLAVGRQGTTNPVLNIDASTGTVVTGLNIKGAAAGGGLAITTTSSGTDEAITLDAKGTGGITIGGTSTGNLTLNSTNTATTIAIGGGTGANTINIGNGNTLTGTTQAINIGAGTPAGTGLTNITIGNTLNTGTLNLNSGSGGIKLQVSGTSTVGYVQIGAGGAGTATPDYLVLDIKNTTGNPSGTNGAMYYNQTDGVFRCYQAGAWADCLQGGASSTALSAITNASGLRTLSNANYAQTWGWGTLTNQIAMTWTGNTAQTTGGLLVLGTAATTKYVHTTTDTGSLASIAFSDESTNGSGTSISNGLLVSPTINGTSGAGIREINGISIAPTFTACSAGTCTVQGVNIGNVSDAAGFTGTGIKIGTGWDNEIQFADTTPVIVTADGGTLAFTDGTNTLMSIKDQGTYAFLNLAPKTDTGDPASCAEGDIYYNSNDDTIKICHTGNTWESLDNNADWITTKRKTADETLVNSTAVQNDDHLTFSVGASQNWIFHFEVDVRAAGSTPDIKFNVSTPASPTYCRFNINDVENAVSIPDNACNGAGVGGTALLAATTDQFYVDGSVDNGSTAGTVALRWAQNVLHSTNTLTVYRGSFMEAFRVQGADLAEFYNTDDPTIKPGDIVSLDPNKVAGVKKSENAYDSTAVGVVSSKPGLAIGDQNNNAAGRPIPVALTGRVPIKVTGENGNITAGDYLTSSSTPGVAMKATKAGIIIAQALTSYSFPQGGTGTVLGFIKNSYSQGSRLTQGPDPPIDSAGVLNLLMYSKDSLKETGLSEINTDRLVAGLELVTPKITTHDLYADSITVDRIKANHIEGIEFPVASQSAQITSATSSATYTDITFDRGIASIDLNVLGAFTASGDINLLGSTTFNSDTAGIAVISAGSRRVDVTFSKDYLAPPIVNANPLWDIDSDTLNQAADQVLTLLPKQDFIVAAVTNHGFTILLEQPAVTDMKFSWIAIAVKNTRTTSSNPITPTPTPTPIITPEPTQIIPPTPTP